MTRSPAEPSATGPTPSWSGPRHGSFSPYGTDYSLESLEVTGAERRPDGSWRVALLADGEALRANVPAGDPADATILIIPT
jgi:hypothetical protein